MVGQQSAALSLPGQLATELARVAALRETYRAVQGPAGPLVMVGPEITTMTTAIELAIVAFDEGDVVFHVQALQLLRQIAEH